MIKNTVILISILFLVPGMLLGQAKVGTSAVPFLGIAVSPRAVSMGGTFVAVANDASTLYWNPGGISRSGRSEFSFSHTNWLVKTKFDWAGAVINLNGSDAFGVSFTQLDYGEELVTNEDQQNGTGEKWSAADIAIGFSYAKNLTDRFSIGGSLKYIQERIWHESASAFAVDVGLLYLTDFNGLRIGMSISNFGTDLRMDGKDLFRQIDLDPENTGTNKTIVSRLKVEDWPLPLFFRAGIAMDVLKSDDVRVMVAADAMRPSDNAEVINVGTEVSFSEVLFLRAGMKSLFLPESQEGYTLGAGAKYELNAATTVGIDYSYQDFGLFGGIQSFSVSITF